MKIWMCVSEDELSLPCAVASSAEELAKMCEVSKATIYVNIMRSKRNGTFPKYVVVDIDSSLDTD